MNVLRARQEDRRIAVSRSIAWMKGVFLVVVLPLCFTAGEANAARLTFEPNNITVKAIPGESVAVPISATLSESTSPSSSVSFTLVRVGGTLNPAWISGQLYVSLNPSYLTRQAVLQIRLPENVKSGVYTAILRTMGLRSNEFIAPTDFIFKVEVNQKTCSQVPLFSEISSSEEVFNARNNKLVSVDLSGSVSVPPGCEIDRVWYRLTDEYGEMDKEEMVVVNGDGSFSASVPMLVARNGNDKDGRLYEVKFMAENESGVSESPAIDFVVTHDNRKK